MLRLIFRRDASVYWGNDCIGIVLNGGRGLWYPRDRNGNPVPPHPTRRQAGEALLDRFSEEMGERAREVARNAR